MHHRLTCAARLRSTSVAAALVIGCGAPEDSDTMAAEGRTYLGDVKPIVDARCVPCHQDGGPAPFPLTDYESVRNWRASMATAVESLEMPPWHAAADCAEYVADRSLTDEQIATLVEFGEGEGPEGTVEADPLDVGPSFALSRVDLSLTMTQSYAPNFEQGDDYRCFVLDWPSPETTFVTGLRVTPGDTASVHHAIVFVANPEQVGAIVDLDAAEDGPGYTCYGGPQAAASWLGVWVPGTGGADYPAGTGIEVEPDSKIVLQVHYSSHGGDSSDRTSVDLRLDTEVMKTAWIQPWLDPTWLGEGALDIPAGDPDVSYSAAFDPGLFLTDGKPLVVYSVGLHMHALGRSGRVWVERAGGDDECLLDIPSWDFHWQGAYGFAAPRTIVPGDRLGIECQWDNSAENQPTIDGVLQAPRDVDWGEGTLDEMCMAALYVTL